MFQSSHRGTHTKLAWVLLSTNSSSITLSNDPDQENDSNGLASSTIACTTRRIMGSGHTLACCEEGRNGCVDAECSSCGNVRHASVA